jgi:hypothetical protein
MSYALDVAPDAQAAFRTLDLEVQEAVLDVLDNLAREGPKLKPVKQGHLVLVSTPGGRTYVWLRLAVVHRRRTLTLATLHAVIL